MAKSIEMGPRPEEEISEEPIEAEAEKGENVIEQISPEVEKAQELIDKLRDAVRNPEYTKSKAYIQIKDKVEAALDGGEKGMSDFYIQVAKAFDREAKKGGIPKATVGAMHDQIKMVSGQLSEAVGLVEALKDLLAVGDNAELKEAA
jgi:hypothetical protein